MFRSVSEKENIGLKLGCSKVEYGGKKTRIMDVRNQRDMNG